MYINIKYCPSIFYSESIYALQILHENCFLCIYMLRIPEEILVALKLTF